MVTHDAARGDDRRPDPLPGRRPHRPGGRPSTAAEVLAAMQEVSCTMTRVALKGCWARKIRAVLTALAIVLGVAMVSGTFVLTDTISKAFTPIFTTAYEQTDAVVSGKKLVDYSRAATRRSRAPLLARIRSLPASRAAGRLDLDLSATRRSAKLIGKDGKAIGNGRQPDVRLRHRPVAAALQPAHPDSRPLGDRPGRGRRSTQTRAKNEHFAVGDTVGVAANGPVADVHGLGLARYGDVDSLGGATFAVFTIPTAQRCSAQRATPRSRSRRSTASRRTRSSASSGRSSPAPAEVKTADEQAAEDKKSIGGFITFIRYFLLGFGGLALFVGAFVIFNTLSITVAQRTRELATLRTLGASRRQVLRSVIVESAGARRARVGLRARARASGSPGPELAVRRPRPRPAEGGRRVRPAHVRRRRRASASSSPCSPASCPAIGRPGAADRRRPRRRRCRRGRAAARGRRRRRCCRVAALLLGYAVYRRPARLGRSLLALAVGTLRSSRGSPASRRASSAPRAAVGWPVAAVRRRRGPAGVARTPSQPGAHRRDRCGADDRPRARLVRRRARQGRARLDQQRDRRTSSRATVDRDVEERLVGLPDRGRRRGRDGGRA